MTWTNYDDARQQLEAELVLGTEGMLVDTHKPVRCYTREDSREKRGWYWLSSKEIGGQSYITGAWGIYQGNDNGKIALDVRLEGKPVKISAEDRAAIAARQKSNMARMKAMREAEAERAAQHAGAVWRKYVAEGTSDYLARKRVAAHGLRFSPSGNGTLAVPMIDAVGKVWGLQLIRGKDRGRKLEKEYFPKGLAKQGHYHLLGGLPHGLVLIAEGYATAATLHQATGLPVVVAFDAGNLAPVAAAISKTYRSANILICADDDYLTEGNPGVTAAQNAAHAVSGAVAVPQFAADRAGKKITDYNDLAALEGEPIVRAQIEAALRVAGFEQSAPAAAPSAPGGGGNPDGERPRALAVMPLDDLIERFIPLDDGTGKFIFDHWTRKPAHIDQMKALMPAGARFDDIKRHPVWNSRGACYFDQVGFDPAGDDPTVKLNTWRGWPMLPASGSCERLLELIAYLCNFEAGRHDIYEWLLNWMAYPLQNPGAKMNSAVIMHGPQGTGKSTIFKALAQIYGVNDPYRNYAVILDQKALQSDFNNDWDSKLFVLAEEVVNSSDKWQLRNELKELVTGDRIRIERKFVDAYSQKNHCNIVFLSNENQPLPIDNDDRRHCVIWTPPELDPEYYADIYQELDNGGLAAFYDHLMRLDLAGFHPKQRPPMTEAKLTLINLSAPSEIRFAREWIAGDTEWPVGPCLAPDFYTAYQKWCRMNGEARPRASNQFFGAITRLPGWEKKKARIYETAHFSGDSVPKPILIPPPEVLQAAGSACPPGEQPSKWLTGHILAFANKLENAEKWAA